METWAIQLGAMGLAFVAGMFGHAVAISRRGDPLALYLYQRQLAACETLIRHADELCSERPTKPPAEVSLDYTQAVLSDLLILPQSVFDEAFNLYATCKQLDSGTPDEREGKRAAFANFVSKTRKAMAVDSGSERIVRILQNKQFLEIGTAGNEVEGRRAS